jgi:hypothetical protein
MNEPLWVLLLKVFGGPIVSGLVAAGIMSVVTYWLSRRRFIGERWWERKAEAYSDIIGNLTSMIHSLNLWIEYLESEYVQPGREGSQEMVAREYREARDRVERVSAEGAYSFLKRPQVPCRSWFGSFRFSKGLLLI